MHLQIKKEILKDLTQTDQDDYKECRKLAVIWWSKFNEIREFPNERQCVKFDRISDILKRFFMEQTNERDIKTNKRKWTISFQEILNVYPNVKELHFMNEYRFDDGVLQRLTEQIQRKDNPLRKVVFLYFGFMECDEKGKPMNYHDFKDPDRLDSKLCGKLKNKLGWTLRHNVCGDAGYKITLKKK